MKPYGDWLRDPEFFQEARYRRKRQAFGSWGRRQGYFMGASQQALIMMASGDPWFNSVKLLLHCDGTDASQTNIVDASSIARTLTVVGNAQNDNGRTKFRSMSLLCDGTGDNVTAPNSTDFDFGSGSFTVEAWVYPTTVSSLRFIYANFPASGSSNGIYLYSAATGLLTFSAFNAGTAVLNAFTNASLSPTINIWNHVYCSALSGGENYIGVNGSGANTGNAAVTIGASNGRTMIGSAETEAGTRDWQGSIDELRVTNGVCRYTTGAYVPPAGPMPTST